MTLSFSLLDVFEELRFVWELYLALLLFMMPFARRKKKRLLYTGWIIFGCVSIGYFLVREAGTRFSLPLTVVICLWYILLALAEMLYMRLCFEITTVDALFLGMAAYAAQHLVYVAAVEVLGMLFLPDLSLWFWLYAGGHLLFCAVFYTVIFWVFHRALSACEGRLMTGERPFVFLSLALLSGLMFFSFACQHLFRYSEGNKLIIALMDMLICVMLLGITWMVLRLICTVREQANMELLLSRGEANFVHSRELMDYISRSVHDLKHTLAALRAEGEGPERTKFIRETQEHIIEYQDLVFSENAALNTILVEKSMQCRNRGIRLSCSLEQLSLDFISLPDLYVLLGNAIDNAMESVDQIESPEDRVISFAMKKTQAFISIQTNNYCAKEPELSGGLPKSTKSEPFGHGYGLKSIRYIAEKYGGSMVVSVEDHIFVLQVLLPAAGP